MAAKMQLPLYFVVFFNLVLISVGFSGSKLSGNVIFQTRPQSSSSLAASSGFIAAEGSGNPCRIKVIGVGGGGGNAVNRMLESNTGVLGVELWTVNTDAQALSRSLAPKKLNIGQLTSRLVYFPRLSL
jgi:hypothetical protein